jgi:hypothetical protein
MKRRETKKKLFILPEEEKNPSGRGLGLDLFVLDEVGWDCVSECCTTYRIDQRMLNRIFSRYRPSMVSNEHSDFTKKSLGSVSLDFIAQDMAVGPAELATQMLLQTRFLEIHGDIPLSPPSDRRQIDFARLLLTACDLASLSPLEMLCEYWLSAVGRTGTSIGWLPSQAPLLLREELATEILDTMQIYTEPALHLLIKACLEHGKADPNAQPGYIPLRSILTFAVQHPPLTAPVLACHTTIRKRFGGLQHWTTLDVDRIASKRHRSKESVAWEGIQLAKSCYSNVLKLASEANAGHICWKVATGQVIVHAYLGEQNRDESERRAILQALVEMVCGSASAGQCLLCNTSDDGDPLCKSCTRLARLAAMRRWSVREVRCLLATCAQDSEQSRAQSNPAGITCSSTSLEWVKMRQPSTGITFLHSYSCGSSLWDAQVKLEECSQSIVQQPARRRRRKKRGLQQKHVETDPTLVVVVDAHRHLQNSFRLLKANSD